MLTSDNRTMHLGLEMCVFTAILCLPGTLATNTSDLLSTRHSRGSHGCEFRNFTQVLDHTRPGDGVFNQRYILCKEDWAANGPLLFFTGSEADIMIFFNNSGFMFEMAEQLQGMVVFAEHRDYGQSLLFPGDDAMKSLTVDNALLDFKVLIESLKANFSGLESAPVITVGGSYGGFLSGWMRMKYPDTVTGALSSSAPFGLLGQSLKNISCNSMYHVATGVYRSVSQSCADTISRAWDALNRTASTINGTSWLMDTFDVCHLQRRDFLERLKFWLQTAWFHMAVSNHPYPTDLFNPLPGYPVKEACSHLVSIDQNTTDQDLLRAVARSISVYYNYTGQRNECFDIGWTKVIGPSWSYDKWQYQVCREMLPSDCLKSVTKLPNMFYDRLNAAMAERISACQDRTQVPYNHDLARQFGGHAVANYSNIIFSSGKLDPWWPTGITPAQQTANITVILIDNAAHHLDLQASHPADPPSVTLARQQEIKIIRDWIRAKHQVEV